LLRAGFADRELHTGAITLKKNSSKDNTMVKLVLFDMDGVIFDGKNFWLEFHAAMGTEKQAWQLWKGLGESAYRKLSHLTANSLWRGKSSETFLKMIWARKPVPGVDRVFAYLHDNNIRSAIVSSGPYHLAERARELFDVTEIRANKLYIDPDGKFTGEVDVQVDNNHKDIPAKELMTKFDADIRRRRARNSSSSVKPTAARRYAHASLMGP
jgi:phosphoserine phosphatase